MQTLCLSVMLLSCGVDDPKAATAAPIPKAYFEGGYTVTGSAGNSSIEELVYQGQTLFTVPADWGKVRGVVIANKKSWLVTETKIAGAPLGKGPFHEVNIDWSQTWVGEGQRRKQSYHPNQLYVIPPLNAQADDDEFYCAVVGTVGEVTVDGLIGVIYGQNGKCAFHPLSPPHGTSGTVIHWKKTDKDGNEPPAGTEGTKLKFMLYGGKAKYLGPKVQGGKIVVQAIMGGAPPPEGLGKKLADELSTKNREAAEKKK